MAGAAAGAGFPRYAESVLHLVSGLNLFDIGHVIGAEKLGAIDSQRELGPRLKHFLDAGGVSPFQSGPTTM